MGLDVREFERPPFAQQHIRAAVGASYSPGSTLLLSEWQFAERPRLEAAISDELALFRVRARHATKTVRRSKSGARTSCGWSWCHRLRSACRSCSRSYPLPRSLLTPAVATFLKLGGGWRRGAAGFLLWGAPIVAMLALPLLVTNRYAESRAWKLLSGHASAQSPVVSLMSEYVMLVQPIFAVAGFSYSGCSIRTGWRLPQEDRSAESKPKLYSDNWNFRARCLTGRCYPSSAIRDRPSRRPPSGELSSRGLGAS